MKPMQESLLNSSQCQLPCCTSIQEPFLYPTSGSETLNELSLLPIIASLLFLFFYKQFQLIAFCSLLTVWDGEDCAEMISPHSKYQRFCSQVTSFKQTDAAGHQRLKKQRVHSHLWHFSQRVPFFFSPGCIASQSLAHTCTRTHVLKIRNTWTQWSSSCK